jgi:hypothetical protein
MTTKGKALPTSSEMVFRREGYQPKIRKSLFAEPHRKSLKDLHAEKTRSEDQGPRFPWMVEGNREAEFETKATVKRGKRIRTDDSFVGGKDYEGW